MFIDLNNPKLKPKIHNTLDVYHSYSNLYSKLSSKITDEMVDNTLNALRNFAKVDLLFLFISIKKQTARFLKVILAMVDFTLNYEIEEFKKGIEKIRENDKGRPLKEIIYAEKYDYKIENEIHENVNDSNNNVELGEEEESEGDPNDD